MRAAMLGKFSFEEEDTLLPNGFISEKANPYATQFQEDLRFILQDQYQGLYDPTLADKVKKYRVKQLRCYVTTREYEASVKTHQTTDLNISKTEATGHRLRLTNDNRSQQPITQTEWRGELLCKNTGTVCTRVFSSKRALSRHPVSYTHLTLPTILLV